jgi:hypothetical protein
MSIVNHSQLVSVYCVVLAYAVTAIHATLVLCELLLLTATDNVSCKLIELILHRPTYLVGLSSYAMHGLSIRLF